MWSMTCAGQAGDAGETKIEPTEGRHISLEADTATCVPAKTTPGAWYLVRTGDNIHWDYLVTNEQIRAY